MLLSGCTKLEMHYTIEENGTVEARYIITASRQAEAYADIQDMVDAAMEEAELNGFSVSLYHEEGYIGIEADKTIKIEDFSKADSRMLGFDALPSIIQDFSWDYEPSVFQSVYKIKIDIDLRNIVDQKALDILPSDIRKLAEEAFETSEAKFHITLPGQTVNTNADETEEVKGKNAVRYSWTLRPGEYKTLMIHASLDKKNTKNQPILGIGAGLALLSAIAYLLIRKAKKKTLCNPN